MEFFKPDYDIAHLSYLNKKRSDEAFNAGKKELSYFVLGLAEEAGEVAGALKKLQRGLTERDYLKLRKKLMDAGPEAVKTLGINYTALESSPTLVDLDKNYGTTRHTIANLHFISLKEKFAKELADVFGYLDLIATNSGINLWDAIRDKFNEVSEEMNFEFKI